MGGAVLVATFRMIRRGHVLTSCEVEAPTEHVAAQRARALAIEDVGRSEWVADHDAFDRTRDESREPDDYRDSADEAREERVHEPTQERP